MEILVTGGTGYIGSHTVVELINKGYRPVVADNFSNSRMEVLEAIEKITGEKVIFYDVDFCDKQAAAKIFDKHNITATIHFAAYKAVGESVVDPLKYYYNNLLSLINLLRIHTDRKLNNFIFSSSCTVYGQPDQLPVTEKTPLKKPESPYGKTKQTGEDILADTSAATGMKGISLRYFNPAGSHVSALIGDLPTQAPLNLVPLITQTAIGIRPSMTVFGNDYNTPDGTCIRDYIHVSDVAMAHVKAVERLVNNENKSPYEIFNLGSGNGNSVLEAIHAFEEVSGQKLNYVMGKRRPGDVEKVYSDTSYAMKELNWKPEQTLQDIMRTAWEWEKHLAGK